jgi:peroxiredoxin
MNLLKQTTLLLIIIFTGLQSTYSQWKTKNVAHIKDDVVITYDVIYERELTEKQKKSSYFIKEIVVAFNKDKIVERRFRNSTSTQHSTLYDFNEKKYYNCSASSSGKIAFSSNFSEPLHEASLQPRSNKTVLNLPCDQYITMVKGKPYKIYSTKKFGLRYVKKYCAQGFLLDYVDNDKYLGTYRVVAKKIDYFKLPESSYSLKGFQIHDKNEYDKYRKSKYDKFETVYKKMRDSKAPKFRFRTTTGEKFNYKNTKGKVLVLNFWFTTCPPCKSEIPHLNRLKQEFSEESNVEFIAIALDDHYKLSKFIKANKFDYKLVTDGRYDAKLFSVPSYPTNIIIDKDGMIRYYKVGGISSSRVRELSYKIQDLLETPSSIAE